MMEQTVQTTQNWEADADTDTELQAALAAAQGRRWWNRWSICLSIALLLLAGFLAGVQVQKTFGDTGAADPGAGQGPAGLPGGGGFPGGGNFDADGATGDQSPAPTTGTVRLVDGTTIYIETGAGEVLTVRTDEDTRVLTPGVLADLATGDQVTVEGESTDDGTVTADSVAKAG
jgi:hypothetical protein